MKSRCLQGEKGGRFSLKNPLTGGDRKNFLLQKRGSACVCGHIFGDLGKSGAVWGDFGPFGEI